jgi:hypothetical protein
MFKKINPGKAAWPESLIAAWFAGGQSLPAAAEFFNFKTPAAARLKSP